MTFTRAELLDIFAETVTETLDDLETAADAIKTIAEAAILVHDTLTADPNMMEQPARTRSMRSGQLAADVIRKLTERRLLPKGGKYVA